jgi:toxic protein SymE
MKTSKNEKESEVIKQVNVRNLKIQPIIRFNRRTTTIVPEIKLCGNWLGKLGFHHGQHVVVEARDGLLILKPDTQ